MEPSATAIDASVAPFTSLTASFRKVVPGVITVATPSSLRKYIRPSAKIGDAEWLPPSRCCQCSFPVFASRQDSTPRSLMTYNSSPTAIGDGVNGAPRVVDQATCVPVTSPLPSERTASTAGCEETRGDVHEAVREHRTRHVRKAVLVAHEPDFLAGCRIVGRRAVGADADDLIASVDGDDERRRVSLIERLAPLGLPFHVARALVERDDPRLVVAVAAENQQLLVERGGSAAAVLGCVGKLLRPENLAGLCIEGGCAVASKMHVHAIALDDRRRGRVAVLGVLEIGARQPEGLDVEELASVLGVKSENPQRCASFFLYSGRQPDPAPADDRRRPSASGNRDLPRDVPRFAPLEGKALFAGVALASWPSKLGPFGGLLSRAMAMKTKKEKGKTNKAVRERSA